MQEARPLAYISQALAPKHLALSVYDKELIVVLVVVDKWRHYLEGNPLVIKIDHGSLQFQLHTHLQRKGVSGRLGLHDTIQYREGKENLVADALSRREEKGNYQAITAVVPDWVKDITGSYVKIDWLKKLLT